jgi:RecT family
MSTAVATIQGGALALAPNQATWTPQQLAVVKQIGMEDATQEDLQVFLHVCQRTRLDPFARQIYGITRMQWNPRTKRKEPKLTIQTGIDGFRLVAQRPDIATGKPSGYQGRVGPEWCGEDGVWRGVWIDVKPPSAARVGVWKEGFREPLFAVAHYAEYVQTRAGDNGPVPNDMWSRMPANQLAKCFSADTEVLTDHGFRLFSEVKPDERVMMVTSEGLVPTDSRPFVQDYAGPMVAWRAGNGSSVDFLVTPNHDMRLSSGEVVEAGELLARTDWNYGSDSLPLVITGSRMDVAGVKDEQLAIAAAYLADGWDSEHATFTIGVSRPRKVNALQELSLHRNEYVRHCAGDQATSRSGRVITTRSDRHVFVYADTVLDGTPVLRGKEIDRSLLLALSQRQARVFVDTWAQFDGTASGPRRVRFAREAHADIFELAAVAAGYAVSVRRTRTSDLGDVQEITLSSKTTTRVRRRLAGARTRPGLALEPANASGKVWCVTVASHLIVTRRKGLTLVVNQCAEAAAIRAAWPQDLSGIYAPEEMGRVDRADAAVLTVDAVESGGPPLSPEEIEIGSQVQACEQTLQDGTLDQMRAVLPELQRLYSRAAKGKYDNLVAHISASGRRASKLLKEAELRAAEITPSADPTDSDGVIDGELVDEPVAPEQEPTAAAAVAEPVVEHPAELRSPAQQRSLTQAFTYNGLHQPAQQAEYVEAILGAPPADISKLTSAEADEVLSALRAMAEKRKAGGS